MVWPGAAEQSAITNVWPWRLTTVPWKERAAAPAGKASAATAAAGRMRRITDASFRRNALSPGRSAPGEKVTLLEAESRRSGAVALLVLLARAAPAGVVAPHLLAGLDPALLDDRHRLGLLGAVGGLEPDLVRRTGRRHGHRRARVKAAARVGHVATPGR